MSSTAEPFSYVPQSPTPDSPPATPPLDTSDVRKGPSPSEQPQTSIPNNDDPFFFNRSPFGTITPPMPADELTPGGSPDSAPIDLVTPAASARPSLVDRQVQISDGVNDDHVNGIAGGQGMLGIGNGVGSSELLGRSKSDDSTAFTKPATWSATHASSSSGSGTGKYNAGPQTPTTIQHRNVPGRPETPKGMSSALNAHHSPYHGSPRERVISPVRATGFAEQQRAYVPSSDETPHHNNQISPTDNDPRLPAADGKKEPAIGPSREYVGLGIAYAEREKSRPRHTHGKPDAIPVNVPTNYSAQGQAWPLSRAESSDRAEGKTGPLYGVKEKFTDSQAYWLGLYFFFNLGLTLFNKVVLVSFPFPYTLTGLHALSGCVGCYIALERGSFTPARLTQRENLILGAFSVLYTINIAVSNISLKLVTVPFHQVVRSSTPLFTILISAVLLRTRFTWRKLGSLLPVVAGVGLATYGDYYFTAWGLILTLLGTFLAALKTVVTNLIQTGGGGRLKLHPLDLLMRMSPLAFVQCVMYGWYTGELDRVRAYGATQMTRSKAIALIINGMIAFGLNIVSFTANKKSGPLTMTVSANCKQVMTIALAVFLFNLHITFTNGIGILLTLLGGAGYGWVEYTDKQRRNAKILRA